VVSMPSSAGRYLHDSAIFMVDSVNDLSAYLVESYVLPFLSDQRLHKTLLGLVLAVWLAYIFKKVFAFFNKYGRISYWAMRRHVSKYQKPLVPEDTDERHFVDKLADAVVAEVAKRDVSILVGSSPPRSGVKALEMSVNGSELFKVDCPEGHTSVDGLVSIVTATGHRVGMGSRRKYNGQVVLDTAGHVWKDVHNSAPGSYFIEHKGLQLPISPDWKVAMVSSIDDLDQAVIAVPDPVWSQLGVKLCKSGRFVSGSFVRIYGFKDNQLHYSTGRAKRSEDLFIMNHWCSSLPGFSGTPVFSGTLAVGTHTGFMHGQGSNRATTSFAYHTVVESPGQNRENWVMVDELPEGPVRKMMFRGMGHDVTLSYVGQFYKAETKPRENAGNWTLEDELDEYFDREGFESMFNQVTPAKVVLSEEVKVIDFLEEDVSDLNDIQVRQQLSTQSSVGEFSVAESSCNSECTDDQYERIMIRLIKEGWTPPASKLSKSQSALSAKSLKQQQEKPKEKSASKSPVVVKASVKPKEKSASKSPKPDTKANTVKKTANPKGKSVKESSTAGETGKSADFQKALPP